MNNQGQEIYIVMLLIGGILSIAVVTFIVIAVLQYQRRQHRHEAGIDPDEGPVRAGSIAFSAGDAGGNLQNDRAGAT